MDATKALSEPRQPGAAQSAAPAAAAWLADTSAPPPETINKAAEATAAMWAEYVDFLLNCLPKALADEIRASGGTTMEKLERIHRAI